MLFIIIIIIFFFWQDTNNPDHNGAAEQATCAEPVDIFKGLEDLGEGKHNASLSLDDIFSDNASFTVDNTFSCDDPSFLELMDLDTPMELS